LDYRILPIGPARTDHRSYSETMMFNLPTQYRLPSLECLEVLNSQRIDFYKHYNEFSVRYIMVHKNISKSYVEINYNLDAIEFMALDTLPIIFKDSIFTIYENKNYTPLITLYNNENKLIKSDPRIKYSSSLVTITYKDKQQAKKVLLTFNYRKNLTVYADGKKVTTMPDSINRVLFFPTFEFKELNIKYTN
jgi:hypothetical protein